MDEKWTCIYCGKMNEGKVECGCQDKERVSGKSGCSGSVPHDVIKAKSEEVVGKYMAKMDYDPVLETVFQAIFLDAWLAVMDWEQNDTDEAFETRGDKDGSNHTR